MFASHIARSSALGYDAYMSERTRTTANGESYWLQPHVTPAGWAVLVHTAPKDGRRVIDRLVIEGPDITAETLRSLPIGILAAKAQYGRPQVGRAFARLTAALDGLLHDVAGRPSEGPSTRARLTRPDGTDPAGFSRRVAEAYRDAAQSTSYPAVALAEEAGVPVTTVHRWVRDARRLDLLPPARQGRAG